MSTTASQLTVEVNGRDVGLSELLSKIETELSKVATNSQRTSEEVEKLGNAGQRASSGFASLQQAQSRLMLQQAALARAQGDTARAAELEAAAEQQLSAALVRTDVTARESIALQKQLAQVQTQAAKNAQGGATATAELGEATKGSMLGMLGPAAAAGAAVGLVFGTLKGGADAAQAGAALQGTERSFRSLAASAGLSSQTLLNSMRAAAAGTISDAKLMESANTGLLLSNGKIAKDLPKLIEIARASAQATGQDIGFIFDSLVRGISRGSPQIIDNAGITLDAAGAFEKYAKSIGKSADQLTKADQQQATLNAVVAAGGDIISKAGLSAEGNAQSFAAAGTAVENLKNKLSELLANGLAPAARGLTVVANNVGQVASSSDQANAAVAKAFSGAKNFDDYGKRIGFVSEQLASIGIKTKPLSEAQFNYAQSLQQTGVSAGEAIAQAIAFNGTLVQIGNTQRILKEDFGASAQQIDAISQAMVRVGQSGAAGAGLVEGLTSQLALGTITADQAAVALAAFEQTLRVAATATLVAADAEDRRSEAMRGSLIAQQASTAAAINDTAAKQAASAQHELLQAQIQSVAQSYLALNPNIDAAGVASAVAAGKIDAAVGVYINMTLATARARAELAALQGQAGVGGGAASVSEGRSERDRPGDLAQARAAGLAAQRQRADEASAAEARYQQTLGNTGPALARARAELAKTTKGSKEYYDALNAIASLEKKNAKGGGGGGGGTKLSDQQKLNNSLLADQQKYQDQSTDAAAQYEQKRLQIIQDFQQKMRDAQRTFDQSQLEGRAGFYDNLGAIESAKIRQSASAQYEQAALEAGKIAEEKGADVADKYMSAQEQIISARAKRLSDIEKAEKEKDGGKAEYLKGVDEQYRAAEEAKLARIKEGEGSLAAEHDKQLAEADAKEQEGLGKIATASERAAERKITAMDRAGKKIDEEQLKADQLAKTYDKIAPSAQPGQATPATPTPATPASAPAESQPIDPGKILEKLDELRAAIVAATDKGATKVADAVKAAKRDGGVNS
jgi:hypothetical protein